MEERTYPTPWQDINALVDTLACEVQRILGDELIGLYLHGSLATGDFDPRRSDVDFVVATRRALDRETMASLQRLHEGIRLGSLRWNANYEGSYIPADALRRYDLLNCAHPVIRVDGSFGCTQPGGGT